MEQIGYFCYYSPTWTEEAGFPGYKIFLLYCLGCYTPSLQYYDRYYSQPGRGYKPLYKEQIGDFRLTCCSCEAVFFAGSNGFELFEPVMWDDEEGYSMSESSGMDGTQFERLVQDAQTS